MWMLTPTGIGFSLEIGCGGANGLFGKSSFSGHPYSAILSWDKSLILLACPGMYSTALVGG